MNPVNAFKALADESRLRIFTLLLNHELNVNEIVSILKMGQSRISRHLKILTDSGLINYRRDGLWSFYSVPENGKNRDFINGVSVILNDCRWRQEDSNRADSVIKERVRQTKSFFNSLAPDWENLKKDLFGALNVNEIIISEIDKCLIAADLGCGTGDLAVMLHQKADKVIGVDNSPKMLDKARKYTAGLNPENGSSFDFRIGEMEHLPLRDRETDYTVINMVLHHLNYPLAGLKEAHRVLKNSGRLLIADLMKHDNENMRRKYGDRWLGFKKSEIEEWFLKARFKILKLKEFPLKKELKLFLYILVKE